MKARHRILVVDDEDFVRDSLVALLADEGFDTIAASSAREALRLLETEDLSAMVTDLRMPEMDGLTLLHEARRRAPAVPVVLLTGVGTVPEAVQAMKSGAHDFIQKPVDPEQFVLLVRRAAEHHDLLEQVQVLRSTVEDLRGPSEMVGVSPSLAAVKALIAQVAPTSATVLVTGESGTGKELVAAEVHRLSPRAKASFVRVNCAAVPESLFESEFFGHRRGAFTSAVSDRAGRFAEAEGGTLALDEIGTLRPEMQAKLLRVLETGEYQVVGESRMRIADVRVVAITNEDLAARVREGAFRKDLYYRLNIFPIDVPPLRKRREDVVPIAEHFAARLLREGAAPGGPGPVPALPAEAAAVLRAYDWPGNVRELRNVIERAVILSSGGELDAGLLRRILAAPGLDEAEGDSADLHIRRRLDALERKLILEALERSSGKKRAAASLLGIDPKNVGYYLKKHGISEPPGGGEEVEE
ncbi:MAG: sigma-54-dependent Fis family transcriptional regulator [Planctomycetes bacterium]|nr:sigma-54-dependent Fis family transcriptional regulator [Planctomycetota bacterium]